MPSVRHYLSLIKFSHTIFAMPFALIGFFLGLFSVSIGVWNFSNTEKLRLLTDETMIVKFILIIACMIFARSAAMAFNRYLDRSFDAKNPRTAIREIPAGIISANSTLVFTVG